MVALYAFMLILAIVVFLLTYKLKLKTRFFLALAVWILPSIAITIFALIVRDKPAPGSYTWYAGPAHVNPITPGEEEYNKLTQEAKILEEKNLLKEAIKKYQDALLAKRITVPSYYVLFDIGRLQFQDKRYNEAKQTLRKFLNNVEMELTYKEGKGVKEPPAGGFMVADQTKEHLERLLKDKERAEILIKKIEEMQIK